jgi:hypothetical protein
MAKIPHLLKKNRMAIGFILSPGCEISTPKKGKDKEKEKQTGSSR